MCYFNCSSICSAQRTLHSHQRIIKVSDAAPRPARSVVHACCVDRESCAKTEPASRARLLRGVSRGFLRNNAAKQEILANIKTLVHLDENTGGVSMSVPVTEHNLSTCICGECPTSYFSKGIGTLFCAIGISGVVPERRGCNCPECPVFHTCGLSKGYFCIRGSAR